MQSRAYDDAIHRYELGAFPALAAATQASIAGTLQLLESILKPKLITDLTSESLSNFAAQLRAGGRSEYTVKRHLSTIRAILNWLRDSGLITEVPRIRMPSPRGSKGRPITDQEFAKLLAATPAITGEHHQSWLTLLNGLWLSGLRLGEALDLSWDDPMRFRADLHTYKHPMLAIPAHTQKNRTDQICPITPDFADFLGNLPDPHTGRVFDPRTKTDCFPDLNTASRTISAIGRAAGIVVKEVKGKPHYATAHDLRRSFGFRWANRCLPALLGLLMRHSDAKTTNEFYCGRNAEAFADQLWPKGQS